MPTPLFKPGVSGNPSGKPAGEMNRRPPRSRLAAKKAEELGVDPFEILLLIAAGDFDALYPDTMPGKPGRAFVPLDIRMKAAAETAKYIYPTLKSVEHTGQDGNPLEILMKMGESGLEQRLAELEKQLGHTALPIIQREAEEVRVITQESTPKLSDTAALPPGR